jgi:hypothetical protein
VQPLACSCQPPAAPLHGACSAAPAPPAPLRCRGSPGARRTRRTGTLGSGERRTAPPGPAAWA